MTALLKSESAGDALDWPNLVEARDAARALAVHPNHLVRRCRVELSKIGMAFFASPIGGGNPRWWVHRSFERRLIGDLAKSEVNVGELERFTGKQRRHAIMRWTCVERFRDAKVSRPGRVADWLPELLAALASEFPDLGTITRSTLYRWDRECLSASDVDKLIDDRGGDMRSQGDPAAWAYFKSIFLDARRPSLSTCWERTQAKAVAEGWRWCSETSCRRQLDQRIPPAKRTLHREPGKYRGSFAPYIKRDHERFAAGRCWVGDHAQLDMWCLSRERLVRPFITTWMDWRTSKIVGWVLSPEPNSSTILAAFRAGMYDQDNMGGPSEVVIDNGKDFDAYMWNGQTKAERKQERLLERGYIDEPMFTGVFGLLRIQAHYTIPYGPNGKAPQERWYRVLHDNFDKTFPTYCGSTPEQKPEGLEEVLRARRNVPLFKHVNARLGEFIKGYNANADHQIERLVDEQAGNERLSPNEAMRRGCVTRRVFPDGVLDLAMQTWHQPLRVGRQGVTINVAGVRLSYGALDQALISHKNKKRRVMVSFDPHDLKSVKVYDEKLRLITVATANDAGGLAGGSKVSREHVRKLHQRMREHEKAMRTLEAHPELEYLSKHEALEGIASEDSKPPTPPRPEGPFTLVQTPLDEQAEIDKQARRRKAAGAESATVTDEPVWDVMKRFREVFSSDPAERDEDGPSLLLQEMSEANKQRDRDMEATNAEIANSAA